jgi:OPA family sugar phosphate sensor protein UhpC-like MFS transporter
MVFGVLQHKGIQDVATRVSGLELGGLAGSLSAGWLSDHLTKKNQKEGGKAGNVGLRVKVFPPPPPQNTHTRFISFVRET